MTTPTAEEHGVRWRNMVVVCVRTKHTGTVHVYEDLMLQAVMTVFTSIRETSVNTTVVFSDWMISPM